MQAPSLVAFAAMSGHSIFTILSSIGITESAQLKYELRAYLKLNTNPEVHFRMDQVYHLDSSGLGLLVSLQNEFRSTRFRFSGLRPNVRMVFEFSNLLSYFKIDQDDPASVPVPPAAAAVEKPPASGEVLVLEGKYILTEEGVNYCAQRQIPVKGLRLYKGRTVSGFTWSKINTDLLERFVTHGLLAGMEIERTEFLDKREQILRLTEVVFDGIVMKRFRPMLKLQLMEDETYRRLVGEGVSQERLKTAARDRKARIGELKTEIEELLTKRAGGTLRPQTGRLLDLIDDSIWYLLTQEDSRTTGPLRQRILNALAAYSGRLELSESIALNLMEFLQQAEKAHFLNLAERDPFTRKTPEAIPELLGDPQFRARLIAKAKLQNELLVVNMNFDGNPHNGRAGLVAEISVRNKGTAGNLKRSETLDKGKKGRSARSLAAEEAAEPAFEEMSLLNLAALKELCTEQGIDLETRLIKDDRSDETVASMKLTL